MREQLRKVVAWMLLVVMAISCMPMTALAEIIRVETSGSISIRNLLSISPETTTPYATYTFTVDGVMKDDYKQIVKDGETLIQPNAESAGKKFVGWYDGNTKFTNFGVQTVTETKTVNLVARFEQVFYAFFKDRDGRVIRTVEMSGDDTFDTLDVTFPVGAEESITAWLYEGTETAVSTLSGLTENVTLTPQVEKGHWLTFDSDGGDYIAPVFVMPNAKTVQPANPKKTGYTFGGWVTQKGGNTQFTFGNRLTENQTVYAKWNAGQAKYTVVHWQENADDDAFAYVTSEEKTATSGSKTNATAKKYDGFTAQTIEQQTVAGDGSTIVNVYYKRNEYSVKFYERERGSWNRWNEISAYTITAKYGANIADKWPNAGNGVLWRVEQDGSTYQSGIATMPLNGAKFYKETRKGKYTFTLYYYTQELGSTSYVKHHQNTFMSDHTNWSTTSEDKYPIDGFTYQYSNPDDNSFQNDGSNRYSVKFYYARNSYNIVYTVNGATVDTRSVQYGAPIGNYNHGEPAKPANIPEGYEFVGWFDNASGYGEPVVLSGNMPSHNIVLYAIWRAPVYTATVYLNEEGTQSTVINGVKWGSKLDEAAVNSYKPALAEGETWGGWSTTPDGTKPFNFNTQIYNNISLYPIIRSGAGYKVIYVLNGGAGEVVDERSYAGGAAADVKAFSGTAPTDTQSFLYWTDGTNNYYPNDKLVMPEHNVTLTAVYTQPRGKTSVIYYANYPKPKQDVPTGRASGSYAKQDLIVNGEITIATFEETPFVMPDDYEFVEWNTSVDGKGTSFAPGSKAYVDADVSTNHLYAIWREKKITIYYRAYEGGSVWPEEETVGKKTGDVDGSRATANKNYTFVNWTDKEGNVVSTSASFVPEKKPMTYTAHFTKVAEYTVHHYLFGTTIKVADDGTWTDKSVGDTVTVYPITSVYEKYNGAMPTENSAQITLKTGKNEYTFFYKLPLTLTAKDGTWDYDGTAHHQPEFEADGLLDTDSKAAISLSMTADSAITDAGTKENTIDTNSISGVPSYYNVTCEKGTLKVNQIDVVVTITGHKTEAAYDGDEHSATGYDFASSNDLYTANDFTFTGTDEAKRTDVGTTDMGLDKSMFENTNGNFKTVTFNVTDGYVKINPITTEIIITANSDSKMYDGTALTNSGYTYTNGVLVAGDELTAVVVGSRTDVGDSDNVVESYKVMRGETDVTGNYTFGKSVDGKLTVTVREVELTSGTASKTYDGTALTKDEVTVTKGSFADGEGATYSVTGSQTDVGAGKNTFTYELNKNTKADNYEITTAEGTLTVMAREVLLMVKDAEKKYGDSDPEFEDSAEIAKEGSDRGLIAGETLGEYTLKRTNTDEWVGTYNEVLDAECDKWNPNYNVTVIKGTFTITGAPAEAEKTSPKVESNYELGDKIPFTITVQNISDHVLENVVVTDATATILAGNGYTVTGNAATIAELPVGGSIVVAAEHTVTSEDILNATYENTANIQADNRIVEAKETVTEFDEVDRTLTVEKTVTSEPANGEAYVLNETISYEIKVTNNGNVPMYNVVVEDALTGLKETIKILAVNESKTFETEYTVTLDDAKAGTVENVATAKADPIKDETPEGEGKVTETLDPLMAVSGTKTWVDSDNAYHTRPDAITIRLMNGETEVASAQTTDADGWAYAFENLPASDTEGNVIVYTVQEDAVAGYETAYQANGYDVENSLKKATLRVRYWYGSVGGDVAQPTFEGTYFYGQPYNVVTPSIPGYTPSYEAVKGTMLEELEVDVVYSANRYQLIIEYVYRGGGQARPSHSEWLYTGADFDVVSPNVDGYYVSAGRVSGKIIDRNVVYTVIYTPIPVRDDDDDDETPEPVITIIDDYEIPLGIGEVGLNLGDCPE